MAPCMRCHGFLYVDLEEVRCLSCGHRPPLIPIPPIYREDGGLCNCGRELVKGKCLPCLYPEGHGERVRNGQKAVRRCRFVMVDGQPCAVLCQPSFYYCMEHRPKRPLRTRKIGPMLPTGVNLEGR